MAFRDVNEKVEGIKSSEMKVGTSIEGYVVGFQEGTYGTNIRFSMDGDTKLVFTSGNLKWMVADKKIKLGQKTRITRLDDERVKGQKGTITKTKFKVEQDPDDVVQVADTTQVPVTTKEESFKEKIAQLKNGKQV